MTKRSRHERATRAAEAEQMREIESAWSRSVPPDTAAAFARSVAEARARGPVPPPPNMAPGTAPNPPRPGREPKPPKEQNRPRRGR